MHLKCSAIAACFEYLRSITSLEILTAVKTKKAVYFRHVMRNDKYRLQHLILLGEIECRRSSCRRRISWLKNRRQWTTMTSTTLFRSTVNKIIWTNVIANIQTREEPHGQSLAFLSLFEINLTKSI